MEMPIGIAVPAFINNSQYVYFENRVIAANAIQCDAMKQMNAIV